MYPAIWGQEFWSVIHLVAFTYPESPSGYKKKSVKLLFENLCPNLPCVGCSAHCLKYIVDTPPKLDSRSTLIKWTIDFHNDVNKRTGKRILSEEEAYEKIKEKYFNYDDWVQMKKHQLIRIEDHKDIEKWKTKALNKNGKQNNMNRNLYFATLLTFIIICLSLVSIIIQSSSITRIT